MKDPKLQALRSFNADERGAPLSMWKVLHGLSPNDLNITFGKSGRLGIKAKLSTLPKQCKESAKSLYVPSFVVMVPRLLNAIPESVNGIFSA